MIDRTRVSDLPVCVILLVKVGGDTKEMQTNKERESKKIQKRLKLKSKQHKNTEKKLQNFNKRKKMNKKIIQNLKFLTIFF